MTLHKGRRMHSSEGRRSGACDSVPSGEVSKHGVCRPIVEKSPHRIACSANIARVHPTMPN
jgi:hypothetical protein